VRPRDRRRLVGGAQLRSRGGSRDRKIPMAKPGERRSHEPSRAFSGKVGTGFPQKMRQIKNLDRFPIGLNRKAI
jgi:hypothetical protein